MTTLAEPAFARVQVDDREERGGLIVALRERLPRVEVARLEYGDVLIGRRVGVERKTLADLAASVGDRRLWGQLWALERVVSRPLLVVEGSDVTDVLRMTAPQWRGVLLSITVGQGIPVLRTQDVAETASWIAEIARREARWLARQHAPPPITPARQALDVLRAIPGVGHERARRLLEGLGSVAAVANASAAELERVAGIGPATVEALHGALTSGPSAEPSPEEPVGGGGSQRDPPPPPGS